MRCKDEASQPSTNDHNIADAWLLCCEGALGGGIKGADSRMSRVYTRSHTEIAA